MLTKTRVGEVKNGMLVTLETPVTIKTLVYSGFSAETEEGEINEITDYLYDTLDTLGVHGYDITVTKREGTKPYPHSNEWG